MDWFKMYAEFATDPKVQAMSEAMQRRLAMLFCLQCSGDLTKLEPEEISLALRIPAKELEKTHALFLKKGFIEEDWSVRNWRKRQAPSDPTARERMRNMRARHAQQQRNVTRHVTDDVRGVTDSLRVDTETDTEGEEEECAAPPRTHASETPRYPDPDRSPLMIAPGPHDMPDGTARELWSMLWEEWHDESLLAGFYQRQRFYKPESWREAVRTVASRRARPKSIGYFEAIAADADARGVTIPVPRAGRPSSGGPRRERPDWLMSREEIRAYGREDTA